MESLTKSSQQENASDAFNGLKPKPQERLILPVLPIRDAVLFPGMVLPLAIGRERSVCALETAVERFNRKIFLVTQKFPETEDPSPEQLFTIGTLGEIVQVFKLPDGSVKTFVQGVKRAKIAEFTKNKERFLEAQIEFLESVPLREDATSEALMRQLIQAFHQYVELNPRIPQETLQTISSLKEPECLVDAIASNVGIKTQAKQELLDVLDVGLRIEQLLVHAHREIEVLNLEKKIQVRVRSQIEKNQKEFVLQEQIKAIQKELKHHDDYTRELEELKTKVKESRMTKEAEEASLKEIERLSKMMPYSPEATVARTYADWLIALPWSKMSRDNLDIGLASKILEEDHYGLEKAKERILEYLAVCRLKKKLRGPILCFVGPPGVGKTSLAKSVARALGRNFVRVSLGGVRDEAEIRGHRKTYIGALPGKIIQQIRKAKTRNPVFLLDEIDKIGTDWRGDPAAALLEVLDPEQNHAFADHYLDVGFDLSDVFFITTANTTFLIPPSLVDRLEVIRLSGYTILEKMQIAKRYLVPKQSKEHGLNRRIQLTFTDETLEFAIRNYTQEAGVRHLDREIAKVCRKVVKNLVSEKKNKIDEVDKVGKVDIEKEEIEKYLGIPRFKRGAQTPNGVGIATALAWTEQGGELLTIEVASVSGDGKLILTGKLGDVMQESAQAAFTYVKGLSVGLPFETQLLKSKDFHLHVPEGAVPKDGPSAGIAMAIALASFLSGRAVRNSLTMTGEITLKGRVMAVGGIREKLVAAHREGVETVLIPKDNEKDLEEMPEEIKTQMEIIPVFHMNEVLEKALL